VVKVFATLADFIVWYLTNNGEMAFFGFVLFVDAGTVGMFFFNPTLPRARNLVRPGLIARPVRSGRVPQHDHDNVGLI
jgi:hypothetical protein